MIPDQPTPTASSGGDYDANARAYVLHKLFLDHAFRDQRTYYESQVTRNRVAAGQVNILRATMTFLAGLTSALAGYIVYDLLSPGGLCNANEPDICGTMQTLLPVLPFLSIILPAIGAGLTTLGDLYQWERLSTIYDEALKNLEVADAQSPKPNMAPDEYQHWLRIYALGTLSVMRDETAQWGQSIKTPAALDDYLVRAKIQAEAASQPPTKRP